MLKMKMMDESKWGWRNRIQTSVGYWGAASSFKGFYEYTEMVTLTANEPRAGLKVR